MKRTVEKVRLTPVRSRPDVERQRARGSIGTLTRQEKQAAILRAMFSEDVTDGQLDAMVAIVGSPEWPSSGKPDRN